MKIFILFVATIIIACDAHFWRRKKCSTDCIADYDPVCGSDGETYSNSCELEKRKCLSGDSTLKEVPCSGKRPVERCSKVCSKDYDPVCGSDKVTYSNQCQFWKAQCQDPTLKLKKRGECDHIEKRPVDRCSEVCSKDYDPVCGSDKVTYSNQCQFWKAQCQDPTLKLKKRGECDHIEKRPVDRCSEVCSQDYDPVCGSDKVTYSNQCQFWKAQCQDPTLKLKKRGECDHIEKRPVDRCSEVCSKDYDPVCGSDKVTYSNQCQFWKAQCQDPTLKLKKRGECDHIEKRPVDRCSEVCSQDYDPVCGSDKVTYSNQCQFWKAQCQDPTLKLKKRGECDHIEKRPVDRCSEVCSKDYDPVCGSDKVTYSNQCQFWKAQCQDPTLKLKKRGECDHIEKRPVDRCSEVCSQDYDPVCGSDKVTYSNQCQFWKAQCQDPTLKLKKRGECDHIGKRSVKRCSEVCTREYDPVCGSDKVTYSNQCQFWKAQCQDPTLKLKKRGECDHIGKRSVERCPEKCITDFDPVCGSDKVTYSNRCYFLMAQCHDPTLKLKGRGECYRYDIGKRPAERCSQVCSKDYDPVCGSDKVTYSNQCQFWKAQCQDPTLKLKKRGECDHIEKRPVDRCSEVCSKDYDPVCGSDKVTYSNQCQFWKAQCQDPTLKLKKRGECDHIGKRSVERCSEVCSKDYDPICGSDKVTYSNQCQFWKAQCQDPTLKLKGRGECDHIDFYCDGSCDGPYDPQCGSDGRMYNNECFFWKEKICHNPDLTIGKKC